MVTMPRMAIAIAAALLALHGAIHLIGAVVYLRWGSIEGFAYKTSVLGGYMNLGDDGIRVFGLLWAAAAAAFIVAAVALLGGWAACRTILLMATLGSLLLTVMDWDVAFIGAIADIGILAGLWLTTDAGLL
jgi:hypothetical protein